MNFFAALKTGSKLFLLKKLVPNVLPTLTQALFEAKLFVPYKFTSKTGT
jgi:hypothetical protein